MKSTGDIVRERYQRHIQGSMKVTRAVALFALQMACADIEEVWRDEYECIRQRCSALLDERNELQRQLDQLQRVYVSEIGLADALEAECIHLRTTISESSAPTGASMAPSEPAASNTSNTADPTPAEPVESTSARDGQGDRVLSARTLRRRRMEQTQRAAQQTEVGDSANDSPFDWPRALAGVLAPIEIRNLETGNMRWFEMSPALQCRVAMRIAETIHGTLGDISQTFYQEYKPHWATSYGSWSKTCDLTWRQVLAHLGVSPSSLPKSKRIGQHATSN